MTLTLKSADGVIFSTSFPLRTIIQSPSCNSNGFPLNSNLQILFINICPKPIQTIRDNNTIFVIFHDTPILDRTNLIKLQFHPEEIFHFIYR